MKTISLEDLKLALENKKPNEVFLDVRTAEEFAEGHIQGAMNISHDLLEGRTSELKNFEQIYIYCRSGGRAQLAAQTLEQAGVRPVSVLAAGGFPDWKAKNYPAE